jgi:hypothetical protein
MRHAGCRAVKARGADRREQVDSIPGYKSGRISATRADSGQIEVDPAELLRVFPSPRHHGGPSAPSPGGGSGALDWPEKAEDWQVETGRCAQSLLSGDNTFIEYAVWLCRTEAEIAL